MDHFGLNLNFIHFQVGPPIGVLLILRCLIERDAGQVGDRFVEQAYLLWIFTFKGLISNKLVNLIIVNTFHFIDAEYIKTIKFFYIMISITEYIFESLYLLML